MQLAKYNSVETMCMNDDFIYALLCYLKDFSCCTLNFYASLLEVLKDTFCTTTSKMS